MISQLSGTLRQLGVGKKPAGMPVTTLKTGLVSWWSLDETSGTRFDSHGANNLSVYGSVDYANGKLSNAAKFANSSVMKLNSNDSSLQAGNTDFSFAFWMNTSSLSQYGNWLINKRGDSTNVEYQILINKSRQQVAIQVFDNGGNTTSKYVFSNTVLQLNRWYFCACGFDNANKIVWISLDGGMKETADGSGITIVSGTGYFALGNVSFQNDTSMAHNGLLDEVGFWKRTLTQPEIQQLYNDGAGLSYANLT